MGKPYQIEGQWYHPYHDPEYNVVGIASWYGQAFHGRPTANGELFDKEAISAAHPTLPLPSLVKVTNLENGRELTLRVNDRGPFVGDRLIDLSEAAARELGYRDKGLARVRVQFVRFAERGVLPPKPVRQQTIVQSASLAANKNVSASCSGTSHFIQVGAFDSLGGAQRAANRLAQHGQIEISSIEANGRYLERVRFGPLRSRSDAFSALAVVHRLGFQDAIVVSC